MRTDGLGPGLSRWLEQAAQEIRISGRLLIKDAAFTTVTIITLALAIGANTAMFSVIESVLRQPLPYRNPERMVWITENTVSGANRLAMVIGSDLEQWRERVKSFDRLSVLLSTDAMLVGEEPTQIRVVCVSAGVKPLFGVSPVIGRDFRPEEFEHAPAAPGLRPSDQNRKDTGIAILTERLFRKLGSDARLLGKPVVIAGTPYTVVGVLPSTFRLPVAPSLQLGVGSQDDVDVVLNTTIGPTSRVPGAVLGRLASGAALETAIVELQRIHAAANQTRSEDESTSDLALQVVGLHDQIVGRSKPVLLVLWAAVGFVLLVASVNIIALLLSRYVARHQETAIRIALGASRWRILGQTLTENTLLTGAGGVLGLAIGYVIVRVLANAGAVDVPRLQDAALNTTVLMFSAAVCLVVVLLLSAAPAIAPRVNVGSQLRATAGAILSAARVRRWHSALVVFELACAFIPLAGAGLMLRSLSQVRSEGAIVRPHEVLLGRIQPGPQAGTVSPDDRLRESDRLLRAIESMAAVRSAAVWSATFGIPARVSGVPQRERPPVAMWFSVSPHFREAAGLPLLAGRWFTPADRRATVRAVVVSERFAREFAAGVPSIDWIVGRTTVGPFPPRDSTEREGEMTIIGVVADFRSGRLGILQPDDVNALPQVFYPDALRPTISAELIVRVLGNPLGMVVPIQRAVQTRAGARLVAVRPLEDQLTLATAPRRFNTRLFVAFAGLAMLLVAVGVGGVLRYAVAQRTPEIGLRLALGADRLDILRMILSYAAGLALVGTVIGIAGAAALSKYIAGILYRVPTHDPWAYLIVSSSLILVALVAAYLPARRAMGLEPLSVLRRE
jgi:putative ABC transport system permease protein